MVSSRVSCEDARLARLARTCHALNNPTENLLEHFKKVHLQLQNPKPYSTTIMPRQRSKKLSASRKTAGEPKSELNREEEQSDSDNGSLEMLEKDEDEEELDRLVLGNGPGFKAQLGQDMDWDQESDSEKGGEAREGDIEADTGLEGVDDADVRYSSNLSFRFKLTP